ncbi:MAG: hypothetical protein L3J42_06845 [Hydrogenimonas sp.]|nr:hypothetical protein [Hydrogenimonas sp.]
MNEELFYKRFKLFRTLAVSHKEEALKSCALLGDVCTISTCDDLQSLDTMQPPHLLLLFLTEDIMRSKECLQRLKKIHYWQLLLFCDDPKDSLAMEYALNIHAFSVNKVPGSKKEFIAAIAPVLPQLIERLQESSRAAQMHKIVEMGPAKIFFGSSGQPLYVNGRAKELLGIDKSKDENIGELQLFKPLLESSERRLLKSVDFGDKRLMVCKEEERDGREKLITIMELDQDDERSASHVTRLEFVDRLKDKMAQRLDTSVPLTLLMVHMKNFSQIAESFDWITVHSVQMELNDLLLETFESFESYGLWQPDMALVLFENTPLEDLKKRISSGLSPS